jgi:hypothetical protein
MDRLRFKVLFIISLTLALGALMLRLGWEVTRAEAVGTLVIVALMMLASLGSTPRPYLFKHEHEKAEQPR